MPFYSNAANFALLYYDACCVTHCSRFKISLRNFKILSHDASGFRRESSSINAACGRNFIAEFLKFRADVFKTCAACLLIQPR